MSTQIKSINFSTFLNSKKQQVVFNLERAILNTNAYAVTQFSTTNSFLNIDSRNNQLKFTESLPAETTFTATITPGNYTVTTLMAEIKVQMEAEGTLTYNLTNNALTDIITITATSDLFRLESVTSNIYYEIGFIGTLDATFTIAKTAPDSFDLSGVKVIYIQSSNFGNDRNINVNSSMNLICSIQVDVPYQGVISHQPPLNFINTRIPEMRSVEFALYDEHLRLLDVRSNWAMTFSLMQ